MAAWGKSERLIAGDVQIRDFRCWGETRPFSKDTARGDASAGRPADEAFDVEIELPRRGAHVRAYGRNTFVVDVTSVAILPASDEYLRASPSNAPQTSTLITLSGELAERVARAKRRVLSVSRASARAHERLVACTSPLAIHEGAISLVEALSLDAGELSSAFATHRASTAAWKRLVEQIEYVLATRFAEDLTLDEIARACRVSPFHAARVFRSVTGRSIHQQLVRVRIHHALYELSRGAGALTDIALRTGFSSHSHFTSTFRRLMGVTPSELAANRRAGF